MHKMQDTTKKTCSFKGNFPPYKHCGKIRNAPFKCKGRPKAKCNYFWYKAIICKNKTHQQDVDARGVNEQEEIQQFVTSCFASNVSTQSWLIKKDAQINEEVAYELALLAELDFVHPIFDVSMLKNFLGDPAWILPIEGLAVDEDFSYEEIPVDILERQVKRLRNKEVAIVKVLWRNHLFMVLRGRPRQI